MTWQPIETAPKDGTQILLSTKFCVEGIGHWEPHAVFVIGWHVGGALVHPTHWMQLPDPPGST